jgi:hypothetical protein
VQGPQLVGILLERARLLLHHHHHVLARAEHRGDERRLEV